MPDITELILDDHEWFRRQFAVLDELRRSTPVDPTALRDVWQPLADHLDVHAVAEEEIFYPQLLRRGGDDAEDETLDAIGDHNDIRDGVHAAARHPIGTDAWWDAVQQARDANDEHMAEEENEGLPDFRLHAAPGLRDALGRQFRAFIQRHRDARGIDVGDKDPATYVEQVEDRNRISAGDADETARLDGSLGIGSLKGK
ncbi:hemerythrin domain-containing protein [Pseudonocardia sp. D17]|uniref:hemerythrin domain-containing protein n=1 Tax=Pseudonocardia sp. D17 TaxID=882661 RepID=UPI002B37C297|nr:cation-binding protein [Pseudonocardia sp. D17]